jgi:dihydroorotate dehydrogenase electron transfer subunit
VLNRTFEVNKTDLGTYVMLSFGPVEELPQPGQFYMFHTDYVKKPFSAAFIEDRRLFFIIKKVGPFTRNIPTLLRVEGPYGTPFPLFLEAPTLLSGGAGIAPICFLAQTLQSMGHGFTWYHGESKEDDLRIIDHIPVRPHHLAVMPTPVTDIVLEKPTLYCACGPKPMLKTLVEQFGENGFVSMEERMACGFGACYGCVTPTKDGYKRVCTEGPVFKAGDIQWQML